MFRINRKQMRLLSLGLAGMMALSVTGCGKSEEEKEREAELADMEDGQEDLMLSALESGGQTGDEYYDTEKVVKGDFTKKQAYEATTVTPYYENVTISGMEDLEEILSGRSTVLFGQWQVMSGSFVNEGDPIFTFRFSTDVDEIDLAQAQLSLQRSQESYDSYVTETNQSMAEWYADIVAMDEGYDKQIQLYQYSQSQLQNERTLASMTEALENEQEAYDRMQDDTVYTVNAPISGNVSIKMNDLETDDELSVTDIVVTINDASRVYLVVTDEDHLLRLGQSCFISGGNDSSLDNAEGRVVAAPSGETPVMTQTLENQAYILDTTNTLAAEIQQTMYDRWWWNQSSYDVVADVVEESNVLLVPSECVVNDAGSFYVNVLTDGKLYKRYFTSGGFNGTYYWAVEGLEENMVVVVNDAD